MQTNIKLGFGSYIVVILILIVFALMFLRDTIFESLASTAGGDQILESQQATKETTDLLLSLDKIRLDVSVLQSSYLQSLSPFPNFPIDAQTVNNFGKNNPFIGSFTIVSDRATSSVGAVVYSNQRSTNQGNAVTSVSPSRVNTTRR